MAGEDLTARIEEILKDHLSSKGLCVYRITYRKEGSGWVLRVVLDKPAGSENEYVSITDCEEVTGFLGDRLDELDLMGRSYDLEVSSPGLDRELIFEDDFVRFAGRQVEVKTYEQINGAKHFEGVLIGKEDGVISIDSGGMKLEIPAEKISKINLAIVF